MALFAMPGFRFINRLAYFEVEAEGVVEAHHCSGKCWLWLSTLLQGRFLRMCRFLQDCFLWDCCAVYAQAQELLRHGHTYLDGNGDGEACESLRR